MNRAIITPLLPRRDQWPLAAIIIVVLAAMLLVQGASGPLEVDHYKFWSKLVTSEGMQSAYSGTFPRTYAIYPPLTLYFLWAAGHVYQAFGDPAFELQRALADPTLTFMVKTPGMIFHLLTVALIYHWVRLRQGPRAAGIASLVYGLQPGVLFDAAVWGQPDPVNGFFVLLSAILLIEGRPGWGGAAYGLAAMTKPQSWILAPLLLAYAWRRYGWHQAGRAALAGVIVAVSLTLPFWLFGSWRQLLRLPLQVASVAPWVSVNAHNLWWLVLGENATVIPDFTRMSLGHSWQTVAGSLVAVSIVFCLAVVSLSGRTAWHSLPAMVALQTFAFFFLVTKAHENHAFLALPLLSVVWLRHRGLAALYFAISATFLANMLLHDPSLAPLINAFLLGGQIKLAQFWNAATNLLILASWLVAVAVVAGTAVRAGTLKQRLWLGSHTAVKGTD